MVKIILANNQSQTFLNFYQDLQRQSQEPVEYANYADQLFVFDVSADQPITVVNSKTGRLLSDAEGVYINGYLNSYELAATVALCCDALQVPFVNRELRGAPSLSKLSMYAKLVSAGVSLPLSFCGAKQALMQSADRLPEGFFPAILKRADADRGIDNYKVNSWQDVEDALQPHEARSLWVLQKYIENDGFYMICCYDYEPSFGIYRTLEARPDGNERKAHMYKPKGGANATLLELDTLPADLLETCRQSVKAMNRQIASVDCLLDASGKAYVMEVNYNPQLVTIETFKETRVQAFLDYLQRSW